MKAAVLLCTSVLGTNSGLLASAAVGQSATVRRHVRGSQPDHLDDAVEMEVSAAGGQLPAVPPPADIGADGFPQLLAITHLMSSAQSTAQSLTEQAAELGKRVTQVQTEKVARVAKQKEIFENKLKGQEQENRHLLDQNSQVGQDIEKLKAQNTVITKHAHELQDANIVMRSELTALKSRLKAAGNFVKQSLASTDDSGDSVLSVLDSKVQERLLHVPRHQDIAEVQQQQGLRRAAVPAALSAVRAFANIAPTPAAIGTKVDVAKSAEVASDDDEGDDDDDAAASFIAMSAQVRQEPVVVAAVAPSDPQSMLASLTKGVEALQRQEQASEAQLKQVFFKDFQVGASRKAALVANQKALNATRDSLMSLQHNLKAAENHLQSTKDTLTTRLHTLGGFIQKLGHLVMAPAPEVPHLLQTLPTSIAGEAAPKPPAVPLGDQSVEAVLADSSQA